MGISNAAKKTGAVVISVAMLTSLASCSMLFGKKDVIEAAEKFGDAVAAGDAGKIIKLSDEDEDSEVGEALGVILDDDNYSDDMQAYIEGVEDTIEYEVDESSVKVDGNKAVCDITFTMADYEDLDDGEYEDIDDIVDSIKDLSTKEYEFTIKFEKDGDDWLITNLDSDDFGAIFDYRYYELPVTDITGDYVAVADLTDVFADSLTSSTGVDMDLTGTIEMEFLLSLSEDGSFVFSFSAEDLYNSLVSFINDNLDSMFMSAFGATSVDELESYAQLLGYADYDELKADLGDQIEEAITSELIEDYEQTGTYEVEGNTITMYVDGMESTQGTIEGGCIVMSVDGSELGTDEIDLVFEPVS